jgi:nitrile hydratase accessory protein
MIPFALPGRDGAPSFAEPWHAEAFAAAVALSKAGLFTWSEWVDVFVAEIAREPQRPGEGSEAAYYRQWLGALERLLAERGLATGQEIGATAEDWRRSYLHTPHGKPVHLRRDLPNIFMTDENLIHHEHRASAIPMTVDPASQRAVARRLGFHADR